jgi:hypothetical protein
MTKNTNRLCRKELARRSHLGASTAPSPPKIERRIAYLDPPKRARRNNPALMGHLTERGYIRLKKGYSERIRPMARNMNISFQLLFGICIKKNNSGKIWG